jgi:hypothetical protein
MFPDCSESLRSGQTVKKSPSATETVGPITSIGPLHKPSNPDRWPPSLKVFLIFWGEDRTV